MNACTIVSRRRLAHARVLAASHRLHHPAATFTVLLIDEPGDTGTATTEPFRVVSPAEIGVMDLPLLGMLHSPEALVTALRAPLLAALLGEGGGPVAYLDAEMKLLAPLDELAALATEHGVVLVPNLTGALPADDKRPTPAEVLSRGVFSAGLVALDGAPAATALLDRWPRNLIQQGRNGSPGADEVFQRWLDALPATLGSLHVARDPGFNVGWWNLAAFELEDHDDALHVDRRPVRVFDFEGFEPQRPHLLNERQNRVALSQHPALARLCEAYTQELLDAGQAQLSTQPEPFTHLPDGTALSPRLRRLFAEGHAAGELTESPFTRPGLARFYEWLNQPGKQGAAAGITRYIFRIWEDRIDLRAAYPQLDGPDGPGLAGWMHVYGVEQEPLPPELLPPPPELLAAGRHAAEGLDAGPAWGVNVAGFFRSELGLGEAARLLISGLEAARVPALPVQGALVPPCRQGAEFMFARPAEAAYPISIVCMNGDSIPLFAREVGRRFFDDRHTIALWWWEVGEFPDDWKGAFDYIDEVWVASQHIYDAVAPASPVPVVKVHLPVRLPPIQPYHRDHLGLPDGFLFLYVYDYHSTSARKNPVGLIEAFKRAFPPGSGAKLVLKCINAENLPEHHEQVLLAAGDHPDIVIIDRYVSTDEKNGMIAACDCYVSLHRSEGFGLTPAEAMYLGKPVIATRYGGTLEFMTPENSYLVDYVMAPVGPRAHPYPPHALWADPYLDEAAALMRHVFEHPDEARERGARAARDIRKTHSPEAAGETMATRLRSIWDRLAEERRDAEPPPPSFTKDLRTSVERGPLPLLAGRFAAAKRATWKPVSRVLRPYSVHQRLIDREVVASLERLEDEQRRLDQAQRVSHADAMAASLRERRALREAQRAIDRLQQRVERLEAIADEAAHHVAEHRALPYMAEGSAFETMTHPVVGKVVGFRGGAVERVGRYRAFTDAFRGPEARVRELQLPYLDLLDDYGPVLDVGCGRGELLDLFAERGIAATGVDSDAGMVDHCRAKGHRDVELADANDYLAGREDGSLGAVVSAEVIEHMPYEYLQRFLELSTRKLRPGGVLLAETVNPHAVHALKAFWVDPTHQHPLFPEVVLELCRIHGFAEGFVFHPTGSGDVERDRFSEPVYAVVARTARA